MKCLRDNIKKLTTLSTCFGIITKHFGKGINHLLFSPQLLRRNYIDCLPDILILCLCLHNWKTKWFVRTQTMDFGCIETLLVANEGDRHVLGTKPL
jgi:hypothetical protein